MVDDARVLAGWTVAITAERRREEFGSALERHGATIVYGPAIRMVPLADDSALLRATERCVAQPVDYVVATTAIGFQGWLDAAKAWRLGERLMNSLSAAAILARGPKVRGAVHAAGLREAWSPDTESSAEVLEHLLATGDLSGRRVAVQLHGEPLPGFVEALLAAGAEVIEVPVYRWLPPEDDRPLRRLIEQTVNRALDAVTFTSAPAAINFLRTADAIGLGERTRAALRGPVLCAAVGSVTAVPLLRENLDVLQPERHRLGALIREIVQALPHRAIVLQSTGRRLEIRGQAVLVDEELLALPWASMTLLRELASRPGEVFSLDSLMRPLSGDGRDGHAVEVAADRLRVGLGDPAMVEGTAERGYRLAANT